MAERPLMHSIPEDHSSTTTPQSTPLPSLGFAPGSDFDNSQPEIYVSPPMSPREYSRLQSTGFSRLENDTTAREGAVATGRLNDLTSPYGADTSAAYTNTVTGLGIGSEPATRIPPNPSNRSAPIQAVPRVALARAPSVQSETVSPLGSGDYYGNVPQYSVESTPDLRRDRFSPGPDNGQFDGFQHLQPGTVDYQQVLDSPDPNRLKRQSGISLRSAYGNDFRPTEDCPAAKDFYMGRLSWVSITLMVICLFSCVFSGIFLGLAIKAPRYGRMISSQGTLKPSGAIILTSVIAKLIELSFVTSFVAFLGQVLSRRAFMREQGRGVTLSEMSMWRWVVQPGTLITHWEAAKYAGPTVLGVLSLLSAILATAYTPAAAAVVQPMLKEGNWDNLMMKGKVVSDFANIRHVQQSCQTPIRTDTEFGAGTCAQIEFAGQGYHNYQQFLSTWNAKVKVYNGSNDLGQRPQATSLLYDNTTVTGQWINISDTTAVSRKYGRPINEVSLAMPHAGVFQAARDQRNGIMQPEELDSEGTYTLRASVPSLVLNVLCAGMTEKELDPIVYQSWHPEHNVNGTTWKALYGGYATTTNKTDVDDIFGWTKETILDYPPVFARLPMPFNTILNHTLGTWGRDSIYLLGQGGQDAKSDSTGEYVLCKIRTFVTGNCSTHYTATGSGGAMEAHCDDHKDNMQYLRSDTDWAAAGGNAKKVANWFDVGFDWTNSISLNTGIDDANASNSRLLTQLMLRPTIKDPSNYTVELNPKLPSIAEAIAVLGSFTLLKSTQGAPFVSFWNYTEGLSELDGTLQEPATQLFNASLRAQQYASGGPPAARGWIIILALVFFLNVCVMLYFICHNGLVTDFSEPPNLFALAVNSPPSRLFGGSCGGGPQGEQFKVNWFIGKEGGHLYMEPGEKSEHYGELGIDDLLMGHGHAHEHLHGHSHGHSHSHSHGAVDPALGRYEYVRGDSYSYTPYMGNEGNIGAPAASESSGFMGAVKGRFERLRERGISITPKTQQTRLRPASVAPVPAEMEFVAMEDGVGTNNNARKSRMFETLAKRRSFL